ncbi:hypothetical protein AVEN_131038-1 [Araneus ventricosus]|uniref:Uncharacterized protein n=1 Tax=Araneus ventricosus TaxID=182803 RepID=A0A4Y2H573_ARAVE|nr:hypothetical protein AVEN_131038-1 [Araneus ventricosus]
MKISSEVQNNGFVQFIFDSADHNTRTVDGHGTFHMMEEVQCVTPASAVQTCSCIPPWNGARVCPTGGGDLPDKGVRCIPCTKIFRDGGSGPPLEPPLIPRPKTIPTANIVGKFGFNPIITHDCPNNHGLSRLVMEDVLSLKLRPMDAKIGTIYHWIWTAGPKSAEEPHMGWGGFMKIVAGEI